MENRRLVNYRRTLLEKDGKLNRGPSPFYPTIQKDEKIAGEVAQNFARSKHFADQYRNLENITNAQEKAASGIVRCRTICYQRLFAAADDFIPVKMVEQNLERVFLSISSESFTAFTTQFIWYSFGEPSFSGPALFPTINGIQLTPGQTDKYNSSVVPIDEIWVTFHPLAGANKAYVTIYEGFSAVAK